MIANGFPRGVHTAAGRKGTVALILFLLAGCATRGGPVAYNVQNFGSPDIPVVASVDRAYRVGVGDNLAVSVFNVTELSGEFTIDELGNFEMPLIGKIAAQGHTTDEIREMLNAKLSGGYLHAPKIFVTVKAALSQRITVDGSVSQAGVFAVPGQISLLQAISLAKGTSPDANPRRVVVFRTIGGLRQAAAFDLDEIRHGKAPDPAIFGNDVIVVDGSKSRQAFRDFVNSFPLLTLFRPF